MAFPTYSPLRTPYLQSGGSKSGGGVAPGVGPTGEMFLLFAEPAARANSFVGTEEYLAPEVINAAGHGPGESGLLGAMTDGYGGG